MGNTCQKFSWAEIKSNNYIVAHDKVYDALEFMKINIHPGGLEAIKNKLGTDCTKDYDMHHNGKFLWEKFCIGRVK
jgi:cytochrome b involved in lipid metabolism